MVQETSLGVLAITHYAFVKELKPDHVHVLRMDGRKWRRRVSGHALEKSGYEGLAESLGVEFAVLQTNGNPFADPLA